MKQKQNKTRGRFSPASVIAMVALVLALGGGSAYAGSKVGAKSLKPVTVRTSTQNVNAGALGIASAQCESGEQAISVGVFSNGNGFLQLGGIRVHNLYLTGTDTGHPTGGSVLGTNETNSVRKLTVQVYCLHK